MNFGILGKSLIFFRAHTQEDHVHRGEMVVLSQPFICYLFYWVFVDLD